MNPPLKFQSIKDAKKHIKANRMKVKETHSHSRGQRIQVVTTEGKPRTISVITKRSD